MKAAVVHDFNQPLSIEDVPRPEPGDGQVLVRIEACGLCHTDIHAAHGDWPIKPALPLIPGHEGVGIVEALGPGVGDEIGVGDRVAIPWLGFACGHCRYCNSGRETLCEAQINTGYGMDGGYAEYVAAYARHVVKVPDGVDSLDAAPLSCAGVTGGSISRARSSGPTGTSRTCSSCRRAVAPGCSTRPAHSRRSTKRSMTSSTHATTRRAWSSPSDQRPATETCGAAQRTCAAPASSSNPSYRSVAMCPDSCGGELAVNDRLGARRHLHLRARSAGALACAS
jgi:hypothetical protein